MNLNNVRETARWLLRLTLIAAMVLCLAFTAQHSLSFLATSPALVEHPCQIQVRQLEMDSFPVGVPVCRLDDLVVDGRRLRSESTERSSQWTIVEKRGKGLPTSLEFNGHPHERGSLDFSGAGWLLIAQVRAWSGVFEVQLPDRSTQAIVVQVPERWERATVVEDPPAPLSGSVLITAGSVCALAAWMIAPWRDDRRVALWLLVFLAAFHAIFWATQCVATTNDSPGYVNSLATNLKGAPTYFPPGYPAFLGIIKFFSDENHGRWIALIQHVLAVVAAFWTYLLARRLVPIELALLCGILAGTLSPTNTMSQTVMSEIPTLFAMVGALYFCLRAVETGKYRFAALAGALAGWGALLRAVPLVALLPAIGLLLWFAPHCRRIRLAIVILSAAAAVLLPPVGWFAYKSGKPTISTSAARHLYNRVVYEQRQLDRTGSATRTLLEILDGEDPRKLPFWHLLDRPGFKQLPKGFNVDQLLMSVSREGILKDPFAFVAHSGAVAWQELVGHADYCIPLWGDTNTLDAALESPPPLRLTASGLQWRWRLGEVHHQFWPLLCWAAIIGVLLGLSLRQRGLVLALAWVPAGYLLASASLDYFLTRHSVPTIPFVVVLAIIPLRILLCGWSETDYPPSGRLNQFGGN